MLKQKLVAIAFMSLAAATASAQTAAPAASSPAKKELVAKLLQLQQPGIEAMARNLAEQPAGQIMQGAGNVLRTRIAPDKREALATAINADVKKYVDEAVPLARANAIRLAPSTIGAVLEEKFTEDELKQVVAIMQSQAYAKYTGLQGEMQNALLNKLAAESRAAIEPKIKTLDQTVAKRLGIEPPPAGAAPAAAASGARRAASN